MSINDKIKQIIVDQNLSPSYFADEIGVQRSSISHILSGRNRPSFDIIQKIIRRFPDLGYEWIMEEDTQTSAYASTSTHNSRTRMQPVNVERSVSFRSESATPSYSPSQVNTGARHHELPAATSVGSQSINEGATNPAMGSPSATLTVDKKIERILIFFTDGSFKEYVSASWSTPIFRLLSFAGRLIIMFVSKTLRALHRVRHIWL